MKLFASDFADWTLPELAGVGTALVTFHLRAAATELMTRAELYTVQLTAITLVANTKTYSLTPPAQYEPVRVVSALMGDRPVLPRSQGQLSTMYMNWETITDGPPRYYTQESTDSIRFVPYPNTTYSDTIIPRVALRPTKTGTGVEDFIFNGWADVIAAGAKARLMALSGKPWTDPTGAAANAAAYRLGVSRAIIDANRSLTRIPLFTQMRRI